MVAKIAVRPAVGVQFGREGRRKAREWRESAERLVTEGDTGSGEVGGGGYGGVKRGE